MAPSRRIFLAVLEKLEDYMEFNATLGPDDVKAAIIPADDGDFDGSEEYTSLIEFPVDGNLFQVVVFVFLFPVRFFMHFSIPDVRQLDSEGNATKDISMAMLATCMCLVWLVMGSYAMVASLESLAELLDIPDAVIGFTVSAAGKERLPLGFDMCDVIVSFS